MHDQYSLTLNCFINKNGEQNLFLFVFVCSCSKVFVSLSPPNVVIQPAYHSSLNEIEGVRIACGCSILPLKTTVRGPAPPAAAGF